MKRTISVLLSVILLLSLTACGDSLDAAEVIKVNTAQDSETYVEGEDYQQRWNAWGSSLGKTITMSDNGIYYFDSWGDYRLHFYDFATEQNIILCNQPNCEHKSAECNAVLSGLNVKVVYLSWYQGYLYMVGCDTGISLDYCLYRISADGTTRSKLATLITLPQGETIDCAFHRGYLYFTPDYSGLGKNAVEISRISLSGDGEVETICEFEKDYGASASLKAYGNYLYISYGTFADSEGNDFGGTLYRYQIHTGDLEQVTTTAGKPFAVDDTRIYYTTAEKLMVYNTESGETEVLLENGGPYYLVLENGYLYCDMSDVPWEHPENRTITIIDTNTSQVMEVIPFQVSRADDMAGVCGSIVYAKIFPDVIRRCDTSAETVQWEDMG